MRAGVRAIALWISDYEASKPSPGSPRRGHAGRACGRGAGARPARNSCGARDRRARRRLWRYRHLATLCDRPDLFGPVGVAPTADNVLGAISLAIWTITIIVAVKYALLVLRAENDGEGGVFAVYGLLHRFKNQGGRVLLWSLMLGAGLLFGDGMITPAISVLSAVEGLEVATPAFAPYVLPITVALLTGLFAIQFKGTSGIRRCFRATADRLVRHDLRARPGRDRARTGHLGGIRSHLWCRLPVARGAARGPPDPRRADACRHRRRGYVCGPRALRCPANPHRLVRGGFSGAAAQLSWAGCLSPWRCAGCGR